MLLISSVLPRYSEGQDKCEGETADAKAIAERQGKLESFSLGPLLFRHAVHFTRTGLRKPVAATGNLYNPGLWLNTGSNRDNSSVDLP